MYIVKNKKKKNKKHHYILALVLFFIIILISFGIFAWAYIIYNSPEFNKENLYNKESTIVLSKNGNTIARLGNENRELVTYKDLPQTLIDAIVATEDARFFQHNGFDAMRFLKASIGQLKGDTTAGGASTITMQISKNAYTSNESNGIEGIIRKFTDIYISMFKLERTYSKEELLEFYVNFPYLGSNCYGVETASLNYFGKHVNDLTLSESALIAGLFNAPSDYDPRQNPENATKRRNEVLKLMYKHGYITETQLNDELDITIDSLLVKKTDTNTKYQGFIDTVVEEVINDTGLNPYTVPMVIQTTLDENAQDAIDNVMNNKKNFKDDIIQAGLAITSSTDGSILGIGAGRKRTGARQYNYATMAHRQPGSAIKPFMDYGPYFEYTDATPNTLILDAPYTYTNGTNIFNAARDYKGWITAKQALAESRNIPALKVFQSVDKNKIADYVHSFGIDYGQNLYESASIGAFDGVTALEMSAAYGAYARGGYYIEPYSYTQITYRDNGEIYVKTTKKTKVCSKKTAKYINDILVSAASEYHNLGTLEIGSTQAAAKTGTTTIDSKIIKALDLNESAIMDSWACIYTREYSIGLWYGYDTISQSNYMVPLDGTLGRRRIIKKLVKQLFTTNSNLITSDESFTLDD